MKIFICYASAGMGHRKSAEAIYDYLIRHYPRLQVQLLDALQFSNPFFRTVYSKGYLYLVSRLRPIWGLFYYFSRFTNPLSRPFRFTTNRLNTIKFASYLLKENPQVVISTHFLVNEVVDHLIRHRGLKAHLFSVITDFGVHPYWIVSSVDRFIVALDETKQALIKAGLDRNKILPIGIPVAEDYYKEHDRGRLRSKFKLKQEEFVVLLLGGAAGVGPIGQIVKGLDGLATIMVACGNNRRLYRRLNRKDFKNIRVLGFVDNMCELMSIADVIVTKPGGLSISESMAMGLPMIYICPLPGQETDNARILSKYNVGVFTSNIKQIQDAVLDLEAHPEKLNSARERARRLSNPAALKEIYDEICKSCSGDTS